MNEQTRLLMNKISDKILRIVDDRDDLTRSDLQGVCDAEAYNIIKLVREVGEE